MGIGWGIATGVSHGHRVSHRHRVGNSYRGESWA